MGDRGIGPHEADQGGSPAPGQPAGVDEDSSGARWDDDGGFEPDAPIEADVPAATIPGVAAKGDLFLRGVLDSALPPELGTDAEPERYTVAAVFSRQVSAEERALIERRSALAVLADRGYPGVGLTVSDRRLLITQTNLAMLTGGLAAEVAAFLREVSQQVAAERERRGEERHRWAEAEAARAARVKAEADRVRFE